MGQLVLQWAKKSLDVVNRVMAGEHVVELAGLDALPKLDLPTVKSSPIISVVPVNFGCFGSCAYCCVVHARGHLRSYSIKEVTDRVKATLPAALRKSG